MLLALRRPVLCILPQSAQRFVIAPVQVAFFVNSGSEANDLAMKMARLYSGNYDFLALRNGYHGKRGLNAHSTWRYNMPQAELPHCHVQRAYVHDQLAARCILNMPC